MATNTDTNARKDTKSWLLLDKKYMHAGNTFIKRTLRRHEWQNNIHGEIIVPTATYPQRWKNDAAIINYLGKKTDIPLPRLQCIFEDDGAFYFGTELVPGISMSNLSQEEKEVVKKEVLQHVATLRSLRSDRPGVPGEPYICPHFRVTGLDWKYNSCWRPREDVKGEYVFCHNDLAQHNIIVDPKTLKINAIIDWEYGGFWPDWFEKPYWEKTRALHVDGEDDEVKKCRQWLLDHCEEVIMPQIGSIHGNENGIEKPT